MKFNDLANRRFGKLVAISHFSENGRRYWNCECDCGQLKKARADYLINGKTTSCGCGKKPKTEDLSGMRFGRLVPQTSIFRNGKTYWHCACHCGGTKEVRSDMLKDMKTQSCGCLLYENGVKQLVEERYARRIEGVDAQQLQQKLSSRNKSGYTGVFFNRHKQAWYATIGLRNEQKLIRCSSKDEAIKVRKQSEETYHKPYLDKLNRSGD